MAFSLFPSYFKLYYTSAFGVHVQTVPTTQWSPSASPYGEFEAWSGGVADAETMIDAFVTAEADFFPTTVNFNTWEIYNFPDEDSLPLLVAAKNIDVDGTVVSPGNAQATQATWTFKTTLGNVFRIQQMDVAVGSFAKITSAATSVDQIAFIGLVTDEDAGFSGRDNARPLLFRQISYTLNEKLRREYHLN